MSNRNMNLRLKYIELKRKQNWRSELSYKAMMVTMFFCLFSTVFIITSDLIR
jgi:hypothetical protein